MCAFWLNSRLIWYSVVPGRTLGSPTAIVLMRCAAVRYLSSNSGEVPNADAMLSKPKFAPSLGSNSVTSISSANRSRIAFAYSVRFRRCTTYRPGVLLPTHARSSELASQVVKPAYSASVGCGMPCGGIARTLNLRSTRSQVAACGSRLLRLAVSRLTGSLAGDAVLLLWQLMQYCLSQA